MILLISAFLHDSEAADEEDSDEQAEPDVTDEERVRADDKAKHERDGMFAADAIDTQGQTDDARGHRNKPPTGAHI